MNALPTNTKLADEVYARLLRRSAAATARRMMDGGIVEETRNWGRLRAAVIDFLDAEPRTVADIAAHLGKGPGSIVSVLRRLEVDGLAARAGKVRNPFGQPVTAWVRGVS